MRNIILVHGFLGYGEAPVVHYFKGVRELCERRGYQTWVPTLPPAASIADRAAALVKFADGLPGGSYTLLAHSMGGLDSRYALSHLGFYRRIDTLATLGTPHRGSPIANEVLQHMPRTVDLLMNLGVPIGGLGDLTPSACRSFNRLTEDVPGVRYCSVAASFRPSRLCPWYLPWEHIQELEGDNDGLVSVQSARWGEFLGVWPDTSHAGLLNWDRDNLPKYEELLDKLEEKPAPG
jgi:triacylglycerol lipase